jgi:hypothetical protein
VQDDRAEGHVPDGDVEGGVGDAGVGEGFGQDQGVRVQGRGDACGDGVKLHPGDVRAGRGESDEVPGAAAARAVTELGGQLEAFIPAARYRAALPAQAHPEYDRLLAQATAIHRMPFTESTPESHMTASKLMVDAADELYAVWDGKPARAYGGTADVVAYARQHKTPVTVIWPQGAQRD